MYTESYRDKNFVRSQLSTKQIQIYDETYKKNNPRCNIIHWKMNSFQIATLSNLINFFSVCVCDNSKCKEILKIKNKTLTYILEPDIILIKARSHAYILINLIPFTISVIIRIRLSVSGAVLDLTDWNSFPMTPKFWKIKLYRGFYYKSKKNQSKRIQWWSLTYSYGNNYSIVQTLPQNRCATSDSLQKAK